MKLILPRKSTAIMLDGGPVRDAASVSDSSDEAFAFAPDGTCERFVGNGVASPTDSPDEAFASAPDSPGNGFTGKGFAFAPHGPARGVAFASGGPADSLSISWRFDAAGLPDTGSGLSVFVSSFIRRASVISMPSRSRFSMIVVGILPRTRRVSAR